MTASRTDLERAYALTVAFLATRTSIHAWDRVSRRADAHALDIIETYSRA